MTRFPSLSETTIMSGNSTPNNQFEANAQKQRATTVRWSPGGSIEFLQIIVTLLVLFFD